MVFQIIKRSTIKDMTGKEIRATMPRMKKDITIDTAALEDKLLEKITKKEALEKEMSEKIKNSSEKGLIFHKTMRS